MFEREGVTKGKTPSTKKTLLLTEYLLSVCTCTVLFGVLGRLWGPGPPTLVCLCSPFPSHGRFGKMASFAER